MRILRLDNVRAQRTEFLKLVRLSRLRSVDMMRLEVVLRRNIRDFYEPYKDLGNKEDPPIPHRGVTTTHLRLALEAAELNFSATRVNKLLVIYDDVRDGD